MRKAVKAFARRWHRVAAAERAELRRTPLDAKLAQLARLMESAKALGWTTHTKSELDAVRRRWRKLHRLARK
jgi:hypothetical protein